MHPHSNSANYNLSYAQTSSNRRKFRFHDGDKYHLFTIVKEVLESGHILKDETWKVIVDRYNASYVDDSPPLTTRLARDTFASLRKLVDMKGADNVDEGSEPTLAVVRDIIKLNSFLSNITQGGNVIHDALLRTSAPPPCNRNTLDGNKHTVSKTGMSVVNNSAMLNNNLSLFNLLNNANTSPVDPPFGPVNPGAINSLNVGQLGSVGLSGSAGNPLSGGSINSGSMSSLGLGLVQPQPPTSDTLAHAAKTNVLPEVPSIASSTDSSSPSANMTSPTVHTHSHTRIGLSAHHEEVTTLVQRLLNETKQREEQIIRLLKQQNDMMKMLFITRFDDMNTRLSVLESSMLTSVHGNNIVVPHLAKDQSLQDPSLAGLHTLSQPPHSVLNQFNADQEQHDENSPKRSRTHTSTSNTMVTL